MELIYKRAGMEDLDELVRTRMTVLKAANGLEDTVDLREVERESEEYYRRALADGSHVAYLVYDAEQFVGAGGISFFQVMPTVHNPNGRKAYIMNMYTSPTHRRKGIARRTLALLVEEAKSRKISHISLEATPMGRPLYLAYGFVPMGDEMKLPDSGQEERP